MASSSCLQTRQSTNFDRPLRAVGTATVQRGTIEKPKVALLLAGIVHKFEVAVSSAFWRFNAAALPARVRSPDGNHIRIDGRAAISQPPRAVRMTTSQAGTFQNTKSVKDPIASAKSAGPMIALVQTGL